MKKSVYARHYHIFLCELRQVRKETGLTQADVAERLGQTQSFVSKCERGERRIDVMDLRDFCAAIGISLGDFIRRLEEAIAQEVE